MGSSLCVSMGYHIGIVHLAFAVLILRKGECELPESIDGQRKFGCLCLFYVCSVKGKSSLSSLGIASRNSSVRSGLN